MKKSNRAVILLAAFTLLSVGGDVLACPDIAYAHHGQEHHIRRRYEFSDSRLFGPGNLGSWEHHDGCRRYVYHDGSCAKGWTIIGGETFYFDEEGNALTDSFLSNEGKLRYLKDDGMMLRNKEAAFDGITYIIDGEGTCVPASQTSVYDETAMEYAKGLIGDIISAGMTEQQKADAIYDYVRTNYTYTTTGPLSDCAYSAFYGFRRKSGNCFEYAAVSHYLLSAAGFDDIIVARQSDNYHFWNLVRTSEGWRHFDTTPWEGYERMCLRDTKYLEDNYWDTNNFDKEAYPASL